MRGSRDPRAIGIHPPVDGRQEGDYNKWLLSPFTEHRDSVRLLNAVEWRVCLHIRRHWRRFVRVCKPCELPLDEAGQLLTIRTHFSRLPVSSPLLP